MEADKIIDELIKFSYCYYCGDFRHDRNNKCLWKYGFVCDACLKEQFGKQTKIDNWVSIYEK